MNQPLLIAIGLCLMVMPFLPIQFRDEDRVPLKNQTFARIACFVLGVATIAFSFWWLQ